MAAPLLPLLGALFRGLASSAAVQATARGVAAGATLARGGATVAGASGAATGATGSGAGNSFFSRLAGLLSQQGAPGPAGRAATAAPSPINAWLGRVLNPILPNPAPRNPAQAATMPGLSASQLMSMMGQSQQQVQQAQQQAQQQQAQQANAGQAAVNRNSDVETFKSVVKGIGGMQAGLILLPHTLKDFADGVLATREPLRNFNGQINDAFARLEAQDVRLGIQTAQATSGTTVELADEIAKFNEAFQPVREALATAVNKSATIAVWIGRLLSMGSQAVTILGPAMTLLKMIEDNTKKSSDARSDKTILPENEFLFRMGRGDFVDHNAPLPPLR